MTSSSIQPPFFLHYRNEDEWKSAWHLEKHVRCRDQLLGHMDWACQKDIYRLDKKPMAVDPPVPNQQGPLASPFIRRFLANTVIKPWTGYVRSGLHINNNA
jgi:hypothetical protein